MQRSFGHAMKAGDDGIGFEIEPGQRVAQRRGQRRNIARVVMIGRQYPERWLPAHIVQRTRRLVDDRRSGRPRILRVKRCQQDAVASICLHRLQQPRHRRFAIAHGKANIDLPAQPLLQRACLHRGVDRERRTFRHPDLRIIRRRFRWPDIQDDCAQNRLPQDRRYLDHTAIRKKLLQIPAHRRGGRRVRCAEIDQQHAGARGAYDRVVGRNIHALRLSLTARGTIRVIPSI